MTETKPQPINYSDGPIHTFFGFSYSSYQVVPRADQIEIGGSPR